MSRGNARKRIFLAFFYFPYMGDTNGWDCLLGGASAGNGGDPGTWDWAFERARAMPDKTAGVQMAWLPGSIDPWELRGLTGVQIDPLPQTYGELGKQMKEGAETATEDFKQGATEHINGLGREAMSRLESYDLKSQVLRSAIMKATRTNPAMILPLILRGSTIQREEPLDSLGSDK
jgi:hypothetical protein